MPLYTFTVAQMEPGKPREVRQFPGPTVNAPDYRAAFRLKIHAITEEHVYEAALEIGTTSAGQRVCRYTDRRGRVWRIVITKEEAEV